MDAPLTLAAIVFPLQHVLPLVYLDYWLLFYISVFIDSLQTGHTQREKERGEKKNKEKETKYLIYIYMCMYILMNGLV